MNWRLLSPDVIGQAFRFILAGAANTLLSLVVFQALLFVVSYPIAYALAWLCGLIFVVAVYPTKVFTGGRTDIYARLWLGGAYVSVFATSMGVLHGLARLDLSPRIAILLVVGLTTLLNFAISRIILGSTR